MRIDSIEDIIPENNYVLVKPHNNFTDSNVGLRIDKTFNPHLHAARTGVVVAVPQKLIYRHNLGPDSMPWDTDMELKVGDEVTYHYLAAMTAEENTHTRYLTVGDEMYYFIKYDRIYTAKRGDNIIMLNGFILVEPVRDLALNKFKSVLDIPLRQDKYFGVVRYVGSKVRDYNKIYKKFHGPDRDNIQPGDVVVMDEVCDIPLEYDLHATLDEGKVYYRVQRRYIKAKTNSYVEV